MSQARLRIAPLKGALLSAVVVILILASCQAAEIETGSRPDDLAFAEEVVVPTSTTVIETTIKTTSTTVSETVVLGDATQPFKSLPAVKNPRAVLSNTGIVLPIVRPRDDAWVVSTPCNKLVTMEASDFIGRAHVVLDAGHGGFEPGAVGPNGIAEKDLNLAVALKARDLLKAAGANVVLTRNADYQITTKARGEIAAAVEPALFISIHHNGGAPPTSDRPGTIVFTKTGNPEAKRFGGLFFETLQPVLFDAAVNKQFDYQVYADALDAHEALVQMYDQSVAARDAALVLNGQVPPGATTSIPATTSTVAPGGYRLPQERQLSPTTTVPPTAAATVPVPESLPPPPPFVLEPVLEFKWSGAGNAGVRSWTRPDGQDYLSVLRNSAEVPAVLVEFLYVTNPSEEALLANPAFVDSEAMALADSVIAYFSTSGEGSGFVEDQTGNQPIGGSGTGQNCTDPSFGNTIRIEPVGQQHPTTPDGSATQDSTTTSTEAAN